MSFGCSWGECFCCWRDNVSNSRAQQTLEIGLGLPDHAAVVKPVNMSVGCSWGALCDDVPNSVAQQTLEIRPPKSRAM